MCFRLGAVLWFVFSRTGCGARGRKSPGHPAHGHGDRDRDFGGTDMAASVLAAPVRSKSTTTAFLSVIRGRLNDFGAEGYLADA